MLRLMDAEGDLLRKIYVGMQDVEVQTGTQLLPNWYSVWYSIFNRVFTMVFITDSMFNMDSMLLLVHEKVVFVFVVHEKVGQGVRPRAHCTHSPRGSGKTDMGAFAFALAYLLFSPRGLEETSPCLHPLEPGMLLGSGDAFRGPGSSAGL